MLPIGDDEGQAQGTRFVTMALIAINVLVFFLELSQGSEGALQSFITSAGFYLACGPAAGFAHILFAAGSTVPTVGASGAISGVLGGYLLMFPQNRIRVLTRGGVAYMAHIGGFVAGMALVKLFATRQLATA